MPLPSALARLFAIKAWVIWVKEERNGKWTKVPYQAKYPSRHASTSAPATWGTYQDAIAAQPRQLSSRGIGIVLLGSIVVGIDLDKCIDEEGCIAAWAWAIVQRCASYTEVSPSGRGLRIFGLSKGGESFTLVQSMPDGGRLEAYRNCKRYLTVTGQNHFDGLDGLKVLDDVLVELRTQHEEGKREVGSSGAKVAAGVADSSTSGVFHKKVCKLFDSGLEVEEVVDKIKRQPKRWEDTKAGVYEKERRLNKEVARSFDKWRESKGAQLEVKWSSGRLPMKTLVADAKIAIEALGVECRLNLFRMIGLIQGDVMKQWNGTLTDDGVAWLRTMIWQRFRFDPGKENMYDAVHQLALENAFDPILDYLREQQMQWDGEERIGEWVVTYLGCEDTELNRAIGRLVMIAAVRRARKPGVKFDQIIVLEGPENLGKSTAIRVLAGDEYFSDQSILTIRDEKQQEALRGRWLYEIADLKGINHADVEAVKAFASRQYDRGRRAWGRVVEDQPRRCILFASTNDKHYLKGDTGNRRWWPLPCGRIKINLLRRDRDQLWAEAAVLEAMDEELLLPAHLWDEVKKEQEARLEQHPWMEILRLEHGVKHVLRSVSGVDTGEIEERISSEYLLTDVLKVEIARQRVGDAKQVAALMRRLGWDGPKTLRVQRGSEPVKGYSRLVQAKVIDLDEVRRNKGKED